MSRYHTFPIFLIVLSFLRFSPSVELGSLVRDLRLAKRLVLSVSTVFVLSLIVRFHFDQHVNSKSFAQCDSKSKILLSGLLKNPNTEMADVREILLGPTVKKRNRL